MDINSLLSPQESPASETPPPTGQSPLPSPNTNKRARRPAVEKRKSSGLGQHHITSSPRVAGDQLLTPTGSLASATSHPSSGPIPSPTVVHNGQNARAMRSAASTPSLEVRPPLATLHESRASSGHATPHRQNSTPGMDALADLASMQNHHQLYQQPTRPAAAPLQDFRMNSAGSAKELTITEVSNRSYNSTALSQSESDSIKQLAQHLAEHSHDFQAHVRLVSSLHQGFVNHITRQDAKAPSDPATYDLLKDLRQARQSMDNKFAVGEDLWVEWINDEQLLARNVEERISVMELCGRAVLEEPSSATLWNLYGQYMQYLWAAAHDIDVPSSFADSAAWSDEDRLVGQEVFTWAQMMDVWEHGALATQWRINDSHLVWDPYIDILQEDCLRGSNPQVAQWNPQAPQEKVHRLQALYNERLLKPHSTWDQTFQKFSSFVSRTFGNVAYEGMMADAVRRAEQAKTQISLREPYEFKISKAVQDGNKDAQYLAYAEYLTWEVRNMGVFSFHLVNALYERVTVRFATDATLWEDYIELLITHAAAGVPLLPVVERATRHCPWSGSLWSHRLLTLEAEGKDFREMEGVKHRATETGMLDVGGMEELLKVYIAWCGFLRRKAFEKRSTEDDLDIAEVGIRSALEHVKEIGEKRYGKEYKGDPAYRLERIHIKFFTQMGNIEEARKLWKAVQKIQSNSYDFWYRWYIWEMVLWSKFVTRDDTNKATDLATPREATDILRVALRQCETMDWPEQLIAMFLNHCEQHETVQELRNAMIETRRATKAVQARRERESAEAVAAYNQQQVYQTDTNDLAANSSKRKREDEVAESIEAPSKKAKAGRQQETAHFGDASSSATSQVKRDRENSTIFVKNVAPDTSEATLRQFFRDCGKIVSVALLSDGTTQTATIEFENQEDVLTALSRHGKPLDENELDITSGSNCTLYVTNFPPEADEGYIRNLFKDAGEVVEVRFPSLKFNTHRRFCYVQFLTAAQAQVGAQLDGHALGGKHKLLAKLSEPQKKQDRTGPVYEGREAFVGNLSWDATDDELRELYAPYGEIESIRHPKMMNGKGKGIAFVVYKTKEEAQAAVEATHQKSLRNRILKVEISQPAGNKRHATNVISASPEPSAQINSHGDRSDRANSEASAADYRDRTLIILDVPDTVNDARIRALAEKYGPLKKIVLLPAHQGATVEFEHISDVGKASLGLDGYEISPGRKLRIGTSQELKKMRAEEKANRPPVGGKKNDQKVFAAPHVSRPAQAGARRGGRGGLGFTKRATAGTNDMQGGEMDVDKPQAKSNADFKAMFMKGKEE